MSARRRFFMQLIQKWYGAFVQKGELQNYFRKSGTRAYHFSAI